MERGGKLCDALLLLSLWSGKCHTQPTFSWVSLYSHTEDVTTNFSVWTCTTKDKLYSLFLLSCKYYTVDTHLSLKDNGSQAVCRQSFHTPTAKCLTHTQPSYICCSLNTPLLFNTRQKEGYATTRYQSCRVRRVAKSQWRCLCGHGGILTCFN